MNETVRDELCVDLYSMSKKLVLYLENGKYTVKTWICQLNLPILSRFYAEFVDCGSVRYNF